VLPRCAISRSLTPCVRSQSFAMGFARARKPVEARFGPIRLLETDQDTAYMKTFQRHLEGSGVRQRREWNFNKISVTERMGGLFKRHLATLAREREQPWHKVLGEAADVWNASYVSKLSLNPPNHYSADNFDELLEALYEREPMEEHALYPVVPGFTEEELSEIFAFKPGDTVRVSMRTISKRMGGPVSRDQATEHRPITDNRASSLAVLQALLRAAAQVLGARQGAVASLRLLEGAEGGSASLRRQDALRQEGGLRLRGGDAKVESNLNEARRSEAFNFLRIHVRLKIYPRLESDIRAEAHRLFHRSGTFNLNLHST